MAKTLIDIDEQLLASAGAVLGTQTKRSTVEVALQEVLDRHKRLAALETLRSLGFIAELDDQGFEKNAWG